MFSQLILKEIQMSKNIKIGFIGAGTMGKAIIKGLITSNFINKSNIIASEVTKESSEKIAQELDISVICRGNKTVAEKSDIIVLCTKPFAISGVLDEIKDVLDENKIIVSIAAGVSTETIENVIEKKVSVVRTMPNTPALVGEGMTAVCKGKYANDENVNIVKEIFTKLGRCIEVQEKYINAVTGISGSGPAFMYLIIEALADGGVKLGLTKQVALELATQTALGAAKMVLETGKHPSVLKDEVTTPGGTTIAGLMVMEESNIRYSLAKTVVETAKTASGLG